MNRNKLNRPSDGVLGELESVKDTLHTVSGNIESILSTAASDSEIPILEDVVSHQSGESSSEPSADDQLSLTNKYKTLSERDLEKAAAEAAAEQADFQPPLAPSSDDQDLMLHLDELLIDDELALDLDADFDFELELDQENEPAGSCTAPQASEHSHNDDIDESAADEDGNTITPEQSIMPDIELLNAELGVEPLPTSCEKSSLESATPEMATPGDPTTGDTQPTAPPISHDVMDGSISADCEAGTDSIASLSQNAKLDFGISTSTSFSIVSDNLFGAAEAAPKTPAPLEPEQLTKLIEMVVEAQIPALKRSLLEHLTPLLCQHPPHRDVN
jgi:hypothetical protein